MSDGLPDWKRANGYSALRRADRSAFAWEWLRRTAGYRAAWRAVSASARERAPPPQRFGLERYEDPSRPVPVARPIWSAEIEPRVILARIHDLFPRMQDRVDLLEMTHLVSIAIDKDVEHILFSDGVSSLRVDVVEGSLIGTPSSLSYSVHGLEGAKTALHAVEELIELIAQRGFRTLLGAGSRNERLILELRTADALAAGASHRDIAAVLFGEPALGRRWRSADESYRLRVQRLVRRVRRRLREPQKAWFEATRRSR